MKKLLITAIILLSMIYLTAQEYTLEELIETGLTQSYSISSSQTSYDNSKSSYRSALFGLLPSSSVSYSNMNTEQYQDDSSSKTERVWTEYAGFSLSKTISLNEPSYYNIRTSRNSLKNSELSLEDDRSSIAYTIFSSYLSVLESQKSLAINRENLALQQRIHDQIQVQYNTGEKSLLELKQSEITLIDYEIAVNEAENNLVQQRRELFTYLNLDDMGYSLAEPEYVMYDRSEPITMKLNRTLLQKENSLKSSNLLHVQTIMNFLPTISFSYNYSASSPGEEIYEFSDYDDSYSFGLTASYDIFDIFSKRESYIRRRHNLKLQKLDLDVSKRSHNETVSNLLSDIETLERSKELYESKLSLAEENLEMAQEQYRLGIISLLDLDSAQIDYQDAQLSYNNKYYALMRKQEELNKETAEPILKRW